MLIHDKLPNVRTAAEVIEALSKVDPATPVIMSSDAEGNNFSPLVEVETHTRRYRPEQNWWGEIARRTEDVVAAGGDLDENFHLGPDEGVDVVVLWPLS